MLWGTREFRGAIDGDTKPGKGIIDLINPGRLGPPEVPAADRRLGILATSAAR
jgi:hypothetical protein